MSSIANNINANTIEEDIYQKEQQQYEIPIGVRNEVIPNFTLTEFKFEDRKVLGQ